MKRLYEKDRALFEHWTHDAAVVPIDFYPYWHLRRQRDAEVLRNRWRNWRRDGFEQQCQPVMDMIRESGADVFGASGRSLWPGGGVH